MYSFCNIFPLLENFEFWTLGSILDDFLEPIFVFWVFGGQKFKNWKNLLKVKFLLLKTRKIIFCKIFQFLNFWPSKSQKTKIGPRKTCKNDQRFQNSKISSKVKILLKLYKILAFYEFLWFSILPAQKEQKPWILESFLVIFSKGKLKTQKSFIR